jgi:hypothetical protein
MGKGNELLLSAALQEALSEVEALLTQALGGLAGVALAGRSCCMWQRTVRFVQQVFHASDPTQSSSWIQ